jgi:LysR family glycine cleavage system transcriptional activator
MQRLMGRGVALARTTLAAWDVINGRLVRPFPTALQLTKPYWIVCPRATASLPKIVAFRDWLLAEAAYDAARLREMAATAVAVGSSGGRTPPAQEIAPAR